MNSAATNQKDHLQPNLNFIHHPISNTLNNSPIFAVLKDSFGFIWIGSYNGLARYDGYTFKVYRHHDDDLTSLSSNQINTLFEDENGFLWIGTENAGLNRFNRDQDNFSHFQYQPDNEFSITHNSIKDIHPAPLGRLWLATHDGLNLFDPKTGVSLHFLTSNKNKKNSQKTIIRKIENDGMGGLWLGTKNGLYHFDPNSLTIQLFENDPKDPQSLSSNSIRDLLLDQDDVLWIATWNGGLNRLLKGDKKFKHYLHAKDDQLSISHNGVLSLYEDKHRRELWIGTAMGGVNVFNIDTQQFSHYVNDLADQNSLINGSITTIASSDDGLIWIGGWEGELATFQPESRQFENFRIRPLIDLSAPSKNRNKLVTSILETRNGDLWIGSNGLGLSKISAQPADEIIRENNLETINKLAGNSSIYEQIINSIFEDSAGNIWLGTIYGGLIKYNPDSRLSVQYLHQLDQPNSLVDNDVRGITEDSKGQIWIATYHGISRFNPTTETFKTIDSTIKQFHQIAIDNTGLIWLTSTQEGLVMLDPNSEKLTYFSHQKSNLDSLADNIVWNIQQDSQGLYWLISESGLSRMILNKSDYALSTFKQINQIHYEAFQIDHNDNLWLSQRDQITRYSPGSDHYDTFDINEGVLGNYFSVTAKGSNLIYFGGRKGITRFNPKYISKNIFQQPVVLTDLLIDNKSVPLVAVNNQIKNVAYNTAKIDLPYAISGVTFEFSALNFLSPNKTDYAYQLLGVDKDWISTNAMNRRATYTNLNPGNYLLKLKANTSGQSSVIENLITQVEITVSRPFFMSWWAYSFYLMLAVGSVFGLVIMRTSNINRRAIFLEKAVEQRTQEVELLLEQNRRMFSNVSHELLTPLTLILSPIDLALNRCDLNDAQHIDSIRSSLYQAKKNTLRLTSLVQQLLSYSNKNETRQVPFQQNVNYIVESFYQSFLPLAEKRNISLKLDMVEDVWVNCEADGIETILINLLSNAFKYSPNSSTIKIDLRIQNQYFILSVEDQGLGVPPEQQNEIFNRFTRVESTNQEPVAGLGIGLSLVKELTERLKGRVELFSQVNLGTKVSVFIPLSKARLFRKKFLYQSASINNTFLLDNYFNEEILNGELLSTKHNNRQLLKEKLHNNLNAIDTNEQSDLLNTILIIDDNIEICQLLVELFEPFYLCIIAMNGKEGILKAIKYVPDIILCDVMMPQVDGIKFCKTIKNHPATEHIPIILLTAKGDLEDRKEGWRNHVEDYVLKPFDREELLLRIQNQLAIRKMLRLKYQSQLIGPIEPLHLPEHDTNAIKSTHVEIQLPQKKRDNEFINRLQSSLENNFHNNDFDVLLMAQNVGLSRRQLRRKTLALFDKTPSSLLHDFRFSRACEFLLSGHSVHVSVYNVGWHSTDTFSRLFKSVHGISPSKWQKQNCAGKNQTLSPLNEAN